MSIFIEVYFCYMLSNKILETNFVEIEYQVITIHDSYIALSVLTMHGKKSYWYIENLGNDIAVTCWMFKSLIIKGFQCFIVKLYVLMKYHKCKIVSRNFLRGQLLI